MSDNAVPLRIRRFYEAIHFTTCECHDRRNQYPHTDPPCDNVLCNAALAGDLETLGFALAAHPTAIDGRNTAGLTPLALAANAGKTETVEFLLTHGARVDIMPNNSDVTALHRAAKANAYRCVCLLLEHGAVDYTLHQPGSFAAVGLNAEGLATDVKTQTALSRVASARTQIGQNGYGRPIYRAGRRLLEAAQENETPQVRALLAQSTMTKQNGVNYQRSVVDFYDGMPVVDTCDSHACMLACMGLEWGQTALHAAAVNGNVQVAHLLLEHEARIDIRTKHLCGQGRVASQYVVETANSVDFGSCLDTEAMGNILTAGVGESIDAEAQDLGLTQDGTPAAAPIAMQIEERGSLDRDSLPSPPISPPASPSPVTLPSTSPPPSPAASPPPSPSPTKFQPMDPAAAAAAGPESPGTPPRTPPRGSPSPKGSPSPVGNPVQQVQSPPRKFEQPTW